MVHRFSVGQTTTTKSSQPDEQNGESVFGWGGWGREWYTLHGVFCGTNSYNKKQSTRQAEWEKLGEGREWYTLHSAFCGNNQQKAVGQTSKLKKWGGGM